MLFGHRKNPFAASAELLAAEGFTDNYIAALKKDIEPLKRAKDILLGRNYLICALVIRGRLTESYELFLDAQENMKLDRLEPALLQNLLHNVIFGLFMRDKFKEADALYGKYNAVVLSLHTDSMRRTLAIHECMNGRYENAVTVLAKLLDGDCRFVDLCIVKAALRLDMYERASELCADFGKYDGCGELEAAATKMKKRVFDGLSPKNKVKMIKEKGGKKF